MNNDLMFSSASDEWSTPQALFDELDAEFHFTLDPCACAGNAKCARYFDQEMGGLHRNWGTERVFMNPPYSAVGLWMRKAHTASTRGALVVCLVPARTDTRWFHELAMKGEVRFVRGRLSFGNGGPAPFPSLIVIFRPPTVQS